VRILGVIKTSHQEILLLKWPGSMLPIADILRRYCSLPGLDGIETRFCYNIDNMRDEILRLVSMGVPGARVCNRFRKQNSNFCETDVFQLGAPSRRASKVVYAII
jgi:hypothetical protein